MTSVPSTHRQWKLNGRESFDCLELKESDVPSPQGNEVLIRGELQSDSPYLLQVKH
jgi:hypothetical protein